MKSNDDGTLLLRIGARTVLKQFLRDEDIDKDFVTFDDLVRMRRDLERGKLRSGL